MSLKVKEGNSSFEVCPEGSYITRCFAIIDMGMQENTFFNNISPKVYIGWEIPDKKMADGKPMIVYQNYTASLDKKAKLRSHLEQWRGKGFSKEELSGFELKNVLGAAGYITIGHKSSNDGKIYSNVIGISKLPPGIECPPLFNKKIYFDLDNYTDESYNSVPQGFRNKINLGEIEKMKEEQEMLNNQHNEHDDGIPF